MDNILDKLKDSLLTLLGLCFIILWGFGGFIGCVYWAIKGYLLGVVLSMFIPLYGIISTIISLIS